MTRRVGSYVLAGLICAAPAMGAESVPLKPGEYQVTAVTESSSGEAGKPDTHSRCLKEEHLANPDAVFNYYALNGFKPNPANKVMNVSMRRRRFAGKLSIQKVMVNFTMNMIMKILKEKKR